ncbi:MAG: hypothetical protein K2G86_05240, partial [Prevotella sp.]|nr:hypothetical protein [Prevotella sp.]
GIFIEQDGRRTIVSGECPDVVWLRVEMNSRINEHRFFYSTDGRTFQPAGEPFMMLDGYWKGIRTGLFCYEAATGSAEVRTAGDGRQPAGRGRAMFDFFRYEIDQ